MHQAAFQVIKLYTRDAPIPTIHIYSDFHNCKPSYAQNRGCYNMCDN